MDRPERLQYPLTTLISEGLSVWASRHHLIALLLAKVWIVFCRWKAVCDPIRRILRGLVGRGPVKTRRMQVEILVGRAPSSVSVFAIATSALLLQQCQTACDGEALVMTQPVHDCKRLLASART